MSQSVAPCTAPVYVLHAVALQPKHYPKHYEESHLREAAPMVRVPAFSAILLISGLTGATLMTAQANDQLAPPQTAVERARPAERTIVCNRRHCWAIREGCRLVVAPH